MKLEQKLPDLTWLYVIWRHLAAKFNNVLWIKRHKTRLLCKSYQQKRQFLFSLLLLVNAALSWFILQKIKHFLIKNKKNPNIRTRKRSFRTIMLPDHSSDWTGIVHCICWQNLKNQKSPVYHKTDHQLKALKMFCYRFVNLLIVHKPIRAQSSTGSNQLVEASQNPTF